MTLLEAEFKLPEDSLLAALQPDDAHSTYQFEHTLQFKCDAQHFDGFGDGTQKYISVIRLSLLQEESPLASAVQPNTDSPFSVFERLEHSLNYPGIDRQQDADSLINRLHSNLCGLSDVLKQLVGEL